MTRQTFVGKVMSLLFNMLSRLVVTFLPRSQVSFNFMAAVTICSDFRASQIKSVPVSPSIGHEMRGAIPCLRSGAMGKKNNPTSEVRGGGCREEQPHVQGVKAARAQVG